MTDSRDEPMLKVTLGSVKRGRGSEPSEVRSALHALVDRLPEGEIFAARRFLEFLCAHRPESNIRDWEPPRDLIDDYLDEIDQAELMSLDEYAQVRQGERR